MDSKRYIPPGYSGYIPGDKWKVGSRSSSEPPPIWRSGNPTNAGAPKEERNKSAKQRVRVVSQQRVRSANHFERIATRPMNHSTQFPVQTTEMASQADDDQSYAYDAAPLQFTAERQSRPPSRGAPANRPPPQPVLDGRVVNHQRPDVLFMPDNPFAGLNSYSVRRQNGRFYEPPNARQQVLVQYRDGIPTAGYSGHIPGLKSLVGKPYGDAMKTLRDQKPEIQSN